MKMKENFSKNHNQINSLIKTLNPPNQTSLNNPLQIQEKHKKSISRTYLRHFAKQRKSKQNQNQFQSEYLIMNTILLMRVAYTLKIPDCDNMRNYHLLNAFRKE